MTKKCIAKANIPTDIIKIMYRDRKLEKYIEKIVTEAIWNDFLKFLEDQEEKIINGTVIGIKPRGILKLTRKQRRSKWAKRKEDLRPD